MSTKDTKEGGSIRIPAAPAPGDPSADAGRDRRRAGRPPSSTSSSSTTRRPSPPPTPICSLLPDPPGAPAPAGEAAEYRDALLRVKADFENYKKRIAKDHAATVERAAEKLVVELLPVLDACEAAIVHGVEGVEPVYKSLVDILEKNGLVRLAGEGAAFDPNLHDAVLHEPGDGDEIVITENLRTGYQWNGRVVRPAMVKVRG